jgi:hypothetical protein
MSFVACQWIGAEGSLRTSPAIERTYVESEMARCAETANPKQKEIV